MVWYGKTGRVIWFAWFDSLTSCRYLCSDICWLKLTIVTSSIFEILLTKMLTRTTAGPSAILFGVFFMHGLFCLFSFRMSVEIFVCLIGGADFCICVWICTKWREFQQTRSAEDMYRYARTHTHKRNVSVCDCVPSAARLIWAIYNRRHVGRREKKIFESLRYLLDKHWFVFWF